MNKLILSTTMTVDGVTTVGEWYVAEGEHEAAAQELFADATAMVAGRRTFEGLAGYWSPMTGAWADLVNPMPKFVASRTLQEPLTWNGTLIRGRAGSNAAPRVETVRLGRHAPPLPAGWKRAGRALGQPLPGRPPLSSD